MKDRDPSLYLTHVLESIELAHAYVKGVDFRRFSENQQFRFRRSHAPELETKFDEHHEHHRVERDAQERRAEQRPPP